MPGPIPLKAVRAYLTIQAEEPIPFHTGKLAKTLLYTLVKKLALHRGIRGILSPLHISPLFTPGKREWELGTLVTPRYVKTRRDDGSEEETLEPVEIQGEYIIHVGGEAGLVEEASELLERVRTPLQVNIGGSIIVYKLEKQEDVTPLIEEKGLGGDKITLYLKGPTKLFNVYTKSKLPKFNISAVEVLMAPYMFYTGQLTIDYSLLVEASRTLGNLVETYYSITMVKPLIIPFNDRRTPTMTGRITYIVEARKPAELETIKNVLQTAEIIGVGQSRQNGFGTTTWK